MHNLSFKLGVLASYGILFALFIIVGEYAPFCPEESVNKIAGEVFCSSFLWNVIAYQLIVVISTVFIVYWQNFNRISFPLVLFPNAVLFLLIGLGTSASALNGWVGAIGPETIISNSIYAMPVAVLVSAFVYWGLVFYILKFSTRFSIKQSWFFFIIALMIFSLVSYQLLMELVKYLEQFGRG